MKKKRFCNTKGLSSYSNRPKRTFTDTLQNTTAMKNRLKNFVRVNNIDDVYLGTFVRYVTWKNEKQYFCLGGFLKEKHKNYVKLANDTFHWSVSKKHFNDKKEMIFNTVFFRSLTMSERQEREKMRQQKKQEELKKRNSELRHEMKKNIHF